MKEIIDRYFGTKKKKIIAGSGALCMLIACGFGVYALTKNDDPKLELKKNNYMIEYGEPVTLDFDALVNVKNLDKEDKVYLKKNTKIESNVENDIEVVTKEDGSIEEKDRGFAKVGDYEVNLKYKDETKIVKVSVKDTTKPTLEVPGNIEILQGTDLTTFDFKSLFTATDLSELSDYTIDYSSIDTNTVAEYTIKVSIQDKYDNKEEKDVKVTIIAKPEVALDEVVVQEVITNEDGTKTVKNIVKKQTEASSSGNKVVSNSNNTTVNNNNSGSNSTTKPDNNQGGSNSGGNSSSGSNGSASGSGSGGNSSSGSNSEGGNSSNGSSSGGGSSNNDSNSGSSTPTPPIKVWEYWAECRWCGKHVESSISLQDAINKLKSDTCTDGLAHACHSGSQEVYK